MIRPPFKLSKLSIAIKNASFLRSNDVRAWQAWWKFNKE